MAQDDKEKKVAESDIENVSVNQAESVENDEQKDSLEQKDEVQSIKEEVTNSSEEKEEAVKEEEAEEKEKPQPVENERHSEPEEESKEEPAEANQQNEIAASKEENTPEIAPKAEEPVAEVKEEQKEVVKVEDTSIEETVADADTDEKEEAIAPEKVEATEKTDSTEEKEPEESSSSEDGEKEEHEDEFEHHLDYSNHTKTQLVQVIENEIKDTDMVQLGKILKEIKPAFDELYKEERDQAYKKYLEEGGEKDGFQYKNDELDERFLNAYTTLKEKRHSFYNDQEKQKDKNLHEKQAILERLRQIVDSDETMASLKELKDIQEEWKNTGPVAPQHLKSLWANYNALIDRYYDQRSIYFELKELDRKKNLESKIELCERAEELEKEENIKEAIKTLNELHEEFKHIGPVPKEDQEALWVRFKTASDAVYSKRKDYYDKLKEELKINQVAKEALAEKVKVFNDFDSERISEWNQKTKEILEVQKEWEKIGGLPREVAKEINKQFWSAFKSFFNHKGQFFKKIEKARHENLKLKEELVSKAEELKESDDFHKTAEALKNLQKEWKEIGPVPEKHRNEIYAKFKAACDHFFNRRRQNDNQQEKEFVVNLKKKQELCDELEAMSTSGDIDIDRIEDIIDEWPEIGFVPRNEIKNIQQRFVKSVTQAIDKTDLIEEDAQRIKFSAQFNKLRQGPNSNKIIQKKENSLRRQIAKLENDIDLWKNNLNFFAESKTADKLKAEFNEKIDKASKELHILEEQLRAISNF